MADAQPNRGSVICGQRYRNALEMIEWLCKVFGFQRHVVHAAPDGTVGHAALTLGSSMIFIGSFNNAESPRLLKQPDEIGGAETRDVYLHVLSADEVYARAKLAGAQIVQEIKDQGYGGRGFTCRDPEGHLWSVGTFDPWAGK